MCAIRVEERRKKGASKRLIFPSGQQLGESTYREMHYTEKILQT
jgi:hypothetical protein